MRTAWSRGTSASQCACDRVVHFPGPRPTPHPPLNIGTRKPAYQASAVSSAPSPTTSLSSWRVRHARSCHQISHLRRQLEAVLALCYVYQKLLDDLMKRVPQTIHRQMRREIDLFSCFIAASSWLYLSLLLFVCKIHGSSQIH